MARLLASALIAAVLVASVAALPWPFTVGTIPNKFFVTFGIMPDPFDRSNFYTMPRTTHDALKSSWGKVAAREDTSTLWCRKDDYRVCLIFDSQGSVAGIQVSVAVKDIKGAGIPMDVTKLPEWSQQTLLGEDVYSAVTFFVDSETLKSSRKMTKSDLTAPNGIYIVQTDDQGKEVARLHVAPEESKALEAGFTTQSCFYGMGMHYFQDLSEKTECESQRPYFLLYSPKNQKLHGFGLGMYGKPSKAERGWFEAPSAAVATKIAPNSPECMPKWIDNYGLFTFHIYFVDRPWLCFC